METCYKCSKDIGFSPLDKLGRRDSCPHCDTELRVCKMCQFYDVTAYNECKEPTADRIVEKEKANFCDHFTLGSSQVNDNSKDNLISAADALFKK